MHLTRFLWVGGEKLQNGPGRDTRTWLGQELHALSVRARPPGTLPWGPSQLEGGSLVLLPPSPDLET